MAINKEKLQELVRQYRINSEQLRNNAIANQGAADAIQLLLNELEAEEAKNKKSE